MSDAQAGAKLVGRIDQQYERYETWFSPTVRSSVIIPIDVIEAIVARERARGQALADALMAVLHDRPSAHTDDVWLRARAALEAWENRK